MVKPCLLDVNVLLALGAPDHTHHEIARAWFKSLGRTPWATCPLTECGFVRISANPKLTAGAGNIESAHAVLRAQRALPHHQFWPDDFSLADEPLFGAIERHDHVSDVYLLTHAHRRKARLASFDRGLAALADRAGLRDTVLLLSR